MRWKQEKILRATVKETKRCGTCEVPSGLRRKLLDLADRSSTLLTTTRLTELMKFLFRLLLDWHPTV
jgi:hypothetical protein